MSMRKAAAQFVGAVSTWGLKNIARRPAATMPGKFAMKIDPNIISELAYKLEEGSIVVVGTNGKTTTTNIIADALERQGFSVACNRTGANLSWGVASVLLQTKEAVQWGVFESDELWLARTLPELQSKYVVLLNLFRDQLDRYGEMDRIQDAIVKALEKSPHTILIYNADDPMCAMIANRVPNENIAFGVGEDMNLSQGAVEVQMCQNCLGVMQYEYRQYSQLGSYECPNCGFKRPDLKVFAKNVELGAAIRFEVESTLDNHTAAFSLQQTGTYMIYNVMASYLAAHLAGVNDEVFQRTVDLFDPQNGRLENINIAGRNLLLNLAKNPTGFNQNLKLIAEAPGKKVAAFFVNDNEGDGRDISWLWDCDFEALAAEKDLLVFVGGIRKNDLQVRLKYAGIEAKLIESVNEMVDAALALPEGWNMYAIANYTALPPVRSALLARPDKRNEAAVIAVAESEKPEVEASCAEVKEDALTILSVLPDMLNLNGDAGNASVLCKRCEWRGIAAWVKAVQYGDELSVDGADIIVIGGGPEREMSLALDMLRKHQDELRHYVAEGGVLLASGGGFQMLGNSFVLAGKATEGLGVFDAETTKSAGLAERLIGDAAVSVPGIATPVVGYESHSGMTELAEGVEPFAKVLAGKGNKAAGNIDGACVNNAFGTYLHGPVLAKNPELADMLISRALINKGEEGALEALPDVEEKAANAFMTKRLKVS